MKQKETMKQTKQTTSENQFNQLHSKDFGLLGVVTNVKDAEGFLCLSDLCRILDLQKEKVQPGLDGHLYMVVVEGANGQQQKPFIDEEGLYLLFLISKIKDAVRFQDWLNEVYLNGLHAQRKARFGLGKDDVLVLEEKHTRQVLRYMATADDGVVEQS